MKIAPLIRAIKKHNKNNSDRRIKFKIIHTGQHYDYEMSKVFFKDLDIPEPDVYLGVGSGTHSEQTGKIMIEFEKIMCKEKPDTVVVVGDVNSTLACSLVASKIIYNSGKKPLIAHVEAGLRSFDRKMPEEINRILNDQISDFLFTPTEDANENLIREGVDKEKIFLVGNIMIDNLLFNLKETKKSSVLEEFSLSKNGKLTTNYAVLTLHRPSNVDHVKIFRKIIQALRVVSQKIPIIFPAHPRTKKMIEDLNLADSFLIKDNKTHLIINKGIYLIDPLGYLDFMKLMLHSTFVLSDSGGIQAETTFLGIPCLTLRDNTEWTITVDKGTNILVGTEGKQIIRKSFEILDSRKKEGMTLVLWDGRVAERIIGILQKEVYI